MSRGYEGRFRHPGRLERYGAPGQRSCGRKPGKCNDPVPKSLYELIDPFPCPLTMNYYTKNSAPVAFGTQWIGSCSYLSNLSLLRLTLYLISMPAVKNYFTGQISQNRLPDVPRRLDNRLVQAASNHLASYVALSWVIPALRTDFKRPALANQPGRFFRFP